MKRYPIVVVKTKRLYETLPYKTLISRKSYLAILAWGRKQYLWDDIYPTIELTCGRCGSFVIEFFQLYDIIELLLDDETYVELQSDPVFCGIVARVMRVLKANLSEAWDVVYGEGAKEPSDRNEIAVILNPDCSCYSLFVGEDPEEQVADEPDYSLDPNVSVVKWIGPRQQKQYIPSFKNDAKKDVPPTENVDRKDTTMDSEEEKEEATKEKLPTIVAGVKAMLQSLRADLDNRFEEEKVSCAWLERDYPPILRVIQSLADVLKEEAEAFKDFFMEKEVDFQYYLDSLPDLDYEARRLEEEERMKKLQKKWRELISQGHSSDRLPIDIEVPLSDQYAEIEKIVKEIQGSVDQKKSGES